MESNSGIVGYILAGVIAIVVTVAAGFIGQRIKRSWRGRLRPVVHDKIAVSPKNYRRIALYAIQVAKDPVVLMNGKRVSDFSESGPLTQKGIRPCRDFEVTDGTTPILGFHDHPNDMWVASGYRVSQNTVRPKDGSRFSTSLDGRGDTMTVEDAQAIVELRPSLEGCYARAPDGLARTFVGVLDSWDEAIAETTGWALGWFRRLREVRP